MRATELEKLLRELGLEKLRVVNSHDDTNIMFCCPFHNERNPSCGVSANKEIGGCLACGTSFTLSFLVAHMKGIGVKKAKEWMEERYNVNKKIISKKHIIRRYDEESNGDAEVHDRITLPVYKLAPFRSGKLSHKYLLDRGFSKSTMREFKLGWDESKCRITIPLFWEDGSLCGFIGRATLDPKLPNGKDNPEYIKVYGNKPKYDIYQFEKSKIVFPLDKVQPVDNTVILVEGTLDAMWLYQSGFKNVLSIITSKLHESQVDILRKLGVKKVILMLDNDDSGIEGTKRAYQLLKKDFVVLGVTYPIGKKDPQTLNETEIRKMIEQAKMYGKRELKRLD